MTRLPPEIAPSIAAGNLMRLEDEVRRLETARVAAIHFDIMDGHFVPLLTIGVPILEQMRAITPMHLDVHIMVTNPDHAAVHYLTAGADTLTFPYESALHSHRLISQIREAGVRAGIAINPGTPWELLKPVLPSLDQVTVMGVNPGYSRQAHIPYTIEKVKDIFEYCAENNLGHVKIQVDGGVNTSNIAGLYRAGATQFVAGGAVMGSNDYTLSVQQLQSAALVQERQ